MDPKKLHDSVKKVYVLFSAMHGSLTIRAVSTDKSSLEFLKVSLSRPSDTLIGSLPQIFFIEEYENFIFNPQN